MFRFDITIPDLMTSFHHLTFHLTQAKWYREKGYQIRLDDLHNNPHPLVREMTDSYTDDELATLATDKPKQKLFEQTFLNRFKNEIYNPAIKTYQSFQKQMQDCLPEIQRVYPKMAAMNRTWGFKIWPVYQIQPDLFCRGGCYNYRHDTGIIMRGIVNGFPEKAAGTIIHEIVHLGVEDVLINPNHAPKAPIEHFEKERLVDGICCYVCADNPDWQTRYPWRDGSRHPYQEETEKYAYMDKYIGIQPDANPVPGIMRLIHSRQGKCPFHPKAQGR